jgi:uncharacterized protein YukJ
MNSAAKKGITNTFCLRLKIRLCAEPVIVTCLYWFFPGNGLDNVHIRQGA